MGSGSLELHSNAAQNLGGERRKTVDRAKSRHHTHVRRWDAAQPGYIGDLGQDD